MCTLRSRRARCLIVSIIWLCGMLAGCTPGPQTAPLAATPPGLTPGGVLLSSGAAELSGEANIALGQAIFSGEHASTGFVACASCHTADPQAPNSVGPNLAGVAVRAAARVSGQGALEYIERSIRVHDEYLVAGFPPGLVPALAGQDFDAILADDEVAALVAYLMTLTEPGIGTDPNERAGVALIASVTPKASATPPLTPTATPSTTLTAMLVPTPSMTPTLTLVPTPSASTTSSTTPAPAPTSTPTATIERSATPTPPNEAIATAIADPTTTPLPSPEPPTATLAPAPEPPTALPAPTPEPPTATLVPSQTPTPEPVVVEPPTVTLPSLPDEANLGRYTNCISCHGLHPGQVQMPHPINPTCNTCHRGSPNQIGCLTCHSTHGIDNKHAPEPDLACASCHT